LNVGFDYPKLDGCQATKAPVGGERVEGQLRQVGVVADLQPGELARGDGRVALPVEVDAPQLRPGRRYLFADDGRAPGMPCGQIEHAGL
jgi:hypothetical protein